MSLFSKKKPEPAPTQRDTYSAAAITRRTAELRKRLKEYEGKRISEENTKAWFINPFLQALGWDISNPKIGSFEVVMGGINRADIALTKNKAVKVVIECKRLGEPLQGHVAQLKGYFDHSHAWVGILTDGAEYRFYSFGKNHEKMDTAPFAVVNLSSLQLSGKNAFMMYIVRDKLDVENITELSRAQYVRKGLGGKKIVISDPNVRSEFIRYFPNAAPQRLDELIAFSNAHYYLK